MSGDRHIEMTWHCAACGAQNLGRYKACMACSKPKEAEPYEMPADTAAAVTITDAALLRMAMAGPNWQCAYCGATMRAPDGCCERCGASPVTAGDVAAHAAAAGAPARPPRPPRPRLWQRKWLWWTIGGTLLAAFATTPILLWRSNRPRTYEGVVTKLGWEQVIDVEHYALHDHEDFKDNIPDGAVELVSAGQKVQHYEQVFDHMGTETYQESVTDGYTTETTYDSDCDKSCTASSPICHEECKSSNNGFADCHQVCSGGSVSCTPCTGTAHSRQVATTHTETKFRDKPVYRNEPRYAESFRYKAWDWQPDRTVRTTGSDATNLAWPDNGARDSGLPPHESEREIRSSHYDITLRYDGKVLLFSVHTPHELTEFPIGSKHEIRLRPGLPPLIDHTPAWFPSRATIAP
ncbi:MAG TPA: hypothetical protein VH143_02280 [Kofleriaceae bacterium]|nr:hypothetical protein [Kofleriaceae bacterium]